MVSIPSMPDVELQPDAYVYFIRTRLARGSYVDLAFQQMQPRDIATGGTSYSGGQIYFQTLLSFATLLFGTHTRNTMALARGYDGYGRVIRRLNRELASPQCHLRDEVVLSVSILALQETLVPTDRYSCLKHMQGLERLLELRGPTIAGDATDGRGWQSFQVYKGTRASLLMLALFGKRPSTYSRPDWKVAIEANFPESERPVQAVYDVLADCSVLTAECASLQRLEPTPLDLSFQFESLQHLKESVPELLARLHRWRHSWKCENAAHLADSTGSPGELGQPRRLGDNSPFRAARFRVWSIPVILMLYSVAVIYVLRLLTSIAELRASISFAGIDEPGTLDPWADVDVYKDAERQAALEICHYFPGYLAHTKKAGSSPVAHWAMIMALPALGRESAETAKIAELMQTTIGQLSARVVERFMDVPGVGTRS